METITIVIPLDLPITILMISMKVGLEREQEKLLTVNVELALETKRLLEQQKEWEEQEKVRSSFFGASKNGDSPPALHSFSLL